MVLKVLEDIHSWTETVTTNAMSVLRFLVLGSELGLRVRVAVRVRFGYRWVRFRVVICCRVRVLVGLGLVFLGCVGVIV